MKANVRSFVQLPPGRDEPLASSRTATFAIAFNASLNSAIEVLRLLGFLVGDASGVILRKESMRCIGANC